MLEAKGRGVEGGGRLSCERHRLAHCHQVAVRETEKRQKATKPAVLVWGGCSGHRASMCQFQQVL